MPEFRIGVREREGGIQPLEGQQVIRSSLVGRRTISLCAHVASVHQANPATDRHQVGVTAQVGIIAPQANHTQRRSDRRTEGLQRANAFDPVMLPHFKRRVRYVDIGEIPFLS